MQEPAYIKELEQFLEENATGILEDRKIPIINFSVECPDCEDYDLDKDEI